jgi:hypothetical protein
VTDDQVAVLRDYAAGRAGTRRTIERLGMRDYADLVIALAQNDLDMPRPTESAARKANLARASAILQPLLRHGG